MEVEDNYSKPKSNFECLVQQVEEQSELCDFTVKKGLWEKKFHQCVLAASPFFENIIKGNFVETQTGLVEIKIDTTSNAVEMALMFLYGKKPAFTMDNVGALLELAEFFMIEGLKSACINWIRSEDITKDNCMHVMQLSTKYNFEVTTCIEFIESHLPETFQNKDAVKLSKDSVQYLLSDERFSYVTMDEKLMFLAQWVRTNPNVSTENVIVLFKTIELKEVSYSVWEKTKRNFPFNEITDFDNIVCSADNNTDRHDILIMACDKGFFRCLDIQKDRWYRLNSNIFESQYSQFYVRYPKIAGMMNTLPEIYTVSGFSTVSTVNLETDETKTYELNMIDEDITETGVANVSLTNDTILATVNKQGRIIKVIDSQSVDSQSESDQVEPGPSSRSASREEEIERPGRNSRFNLRQIYAPELYDNKGLFTSTVSGNGEKYLSVEHIDYSDIYYGSVTDETIELSPLFSLRNVEVTEACLSRDSAFALLTSTKKVILFDLVDYTIETIEIQPDTNYEITQTEDGFLVYNNTRCYCLTRLYGPSLSKKYLMSKIELETKEGWFIRYRCCNGIWVRILYTLEKDDIDCIELHYISHEELSTSKSPNDINWKRLSLPDERKIVNKLIKDKDVFVVPLSKSKLRCHIECPHCELSRRNGRGWNHMYLKRFWLDSSDDEYVEQSTSGSDSD